MPDCSHLDQLDQLDLSLLAGGRSADEPAACQECAESGAAWVHLRRCLSCGHIGCCDSSGGRHATRHHHATGHPVVASHQPGETWGWCYPDHAFLEFEESPR
jgi:uncharacterized UBP type Zn finger protein